MINPLSYVHPEAKIGQNVTIDSFTSVAKNVEIGDGTWIGSNVTIMDGARIGKNCRIFPGAVISAIPQDMKFAGEDSVAIIGDNTTIREFVTLNRGTKASFKTSVGNKCLIMAYVHIAHDCSIGDNCILSNAVTLGGHVNIDNWAVVGGMSAIHQFGKIGCHTMISGGSLVLKDVPPYVKAGREPLSFDGINSIGLKRRNFSQEDIEQIHEIYRTLYLKNLNVSQAVSYIESNLPESRYKTEILAFIKNSERGIIKKRGDITISEE
ncbi:MAG: acyl-ACP--UDP-N-acetylglucosamine O-acyltransferase [Bacteroidia bacterium]|nr:acyl-ACP--UDP-N-acetylglucosamine O-acyltransferase [Bacteroidia bacterium]